MQPLYNYFLHSKKDSIIISGELLREKSITYSSNRNIKDTVFRMLMDDERHLLDLFNALEKTQYKDQNLIRINTLKGAIFNSRKNDLSFSVADWFLTIIEHQSTITENAPLRMSIYLNRVWEQVLDLSRAYCSRLYEIPLPRLYLLYNGIENFPQEKIYHLSDSFRMIKGRVPVDLEVKAININMDKHHPILKDCSILREYSIFIQQIREAQEAGRNRDEAVKEAIHKCLEQGILGEFLNRHGREVYNMLFDEITYEDIIRIRVEEAKEIGIEQGIEQGAAGMITSFCEEGFSQKRILEKLENHVGMSRDAAQKCYEKYTQ